MQFLNPIWLLSGLGIIIPIAIHLWNQRPGKMLEVGTVRFIEPDVSKRNAKLHLTELLLLILRCLLILMLACFLAKPNWNNNSVASQKGWLLIPEGTVKEAYQAFPKIIDSLLKEGYEFHLLETGFPSADLKAEMEKTAYKKRINYWALGKDLQNFAPQQLPLWVFTPNTLSGYHGSKPIVRTSLHWLGFPVNKEGLHEIANAFQLNEDSVEVKMTNAMITGLNYQTLRLSFKNNKNKDYRVFDSVGNAFLQYQKQTPVLIDKSILQITVYTDQFQNDAAYLMAVCKAISEFSGRSIKCKMVYKSADIPAKQDWLFWLSDQALLQDNSNVQDKAKNILFYQKGTEYTFKNEIYQSAPLQVKEGIIWEDGFGTPLLQRIAKGRYQMNTHFNAEWNNLVWNKQFPVWMMDLLFSENNMNGLADIRQIDPKQLQPIFQQEGKVGNGIVAFTGKDISYLFWLLICIILAVERCTSYYQAKNRNYV